MFTPLDDFRVRIGYTFKFNFNSYSSGVVSMDFDPMTDKIICLCNRQVIVTLELSAQSVTTCL